MLVRTYLVLVSVAVGSEWCQRSLFSPGKFVHLLWLVVWFECRGRQ